MIVAFIDESGDPHPNDVDEKGNPTPFVVTSILVYSDETLTKATQLLAEVKRKYNLSAELHAKELFHLGKSDLYKNLSQEQAIKLAEDIASIISSLNIRIISIIIERRKKMVGKGNKFHLVKQKDEIEKEIHNLSYSSLFKRIFRHIARNKPNDWLFIVHDKVNEKRQGLINEILSRMLEEDNFSPKILSNPKVVLPITFTDSSKYALLQLTDFIGYVIRRKFYGRRDEFYFDKLYDIISTRFDKSHTGEINNWGLKKWYYTIVYKAEHSGTQAQHPSSLI